MTAITTIERYLVSGWQLLQSGVVELGAGESSHSAQFAAETEQVGEWLVNHHKAKTDQERAAIDSAFEAAMQHSPDFLNWLEDNTDPVAFSRAVKNGKFGAA